MTQYPNDPGLDCQRTPPCEPPRDQYYVVTEQSFLDAMALQTQYSYECSRQLSQQAKDDSTRLCKTIEEKVDHVTSDVHGLVNEMVCMKNATAENFQKLDEMNKNLAKEIAEVEQRQKLYMDGYDYDNLVQQILNA